MLIEVKVVSLTFSDKIVFLTVRACKFGRNNYFAGTEQKTGEEPDESWAT